MGRVKRYQTKDYHPSHVSSLYPRPRGLTFPHFETDSWRYNSVTAQFRGAECRFPFAMLKFQVTDAQTLFEFSSPSSVQLQSTKISWDLEVILYCFTVMVTLNQS